MYQYPHAASEDRTISSQYQVPTQSPAERPHSGLGIASLVMAGLAILSFFAVIIWAGVLEINQPGVLDGESGAALIVGGVLCLTVFISLVGVGLAIAGAVDRTRRRILPVVALCCHGALLLFALLPLAAGD